MYVVPNRRRHMLVEALSIFEEKKKMGTHAARRHTIYMCPAAVTRRTIVFNK